MKKLIIFGLPMLAAIGIACSSGGGSGDDNNSAPSAVATTTGATPTKAGSTSKPPSYTKAQEQAIGTAEDYLGTQHFSKKGLIKQLKFDGFSTADATFAVEHVKVDWNEQAAGAAQDYLDTQHFSRTGLIKQLEFDGFTQAQAEYGVKKAGL